MSPEADMEFEEVKIDEMVLHLWREHLHTELTPTSTIRSRAPLQDDPLPGVATRAPRIIADIGEAVPEGAAFSLVQHIGHMQGIDRYTAIQQSCGRLVELRLLDPATSPESIRGEFLREATLTSHLSHPGIASVEELNVDQKERFFTSMPHIVSRPWSQILAERSLNDNLLILLRVMDGVSFAHSKGILHRDLKPGNILIGLFGEVLVSGWGLGCEAKILHKAEPGSQLHLVGTPAYMAPEVAMGELDKIGIRSDIYQLGAILYEIVTGCPPHLADTLPASLLSAAENTLMEPVDMSPLSSLVERAMTLLPANRFSTVAEFQKMIRDYLAHQESIQITARADLHWQLAKEGEGTLEDYATALALYSESLGLWPENDSLSRHIERVHVDYATAALSAGDLKLAKRILPPDESGLSEEDIEAYRAVSRSVQRKTKRRLCAMVLSVPLFLALVAVALYAYRAWTEERHWVELYSVDFTEPQPDLKRIQFMDATRRNVVHTRPLQGGLWFDNGEWCWLRDIELSGDTRLVIHFDTGGIPDSLEVSINSRPDPVSAGHLLPAGQSLKLVIAGENSTSQLYAHGSPHFREMSGGNVIGLSLPTTNAYTLEFRRRGGRISITLNGKTIQEDFALVPLEGEGLHSIGFRVWQPTTRILSLQVDGPRREPEPSFLLGADSLVRAGNHDAAIQEYMSVSNARRGTPEAEEALFKTFMILSMPRYLHREYTLRNRIAGDMRTHYPNSTFTRYMMEEMVLLEMRMGRYQAMLGALKDLQREFPHANIVEKIWEDRPNSLPPDIRDFLLANYRSSRKRVRLDSTQVAAFPETIEKERFTGAIDIDYNLFDKLDFDDINKSNRIRVEWNRLRMLKGTPSTELSFLVISGNHLADFDALRDLKELSVISVQNNRIRSLAPFAPDSLPKLMDLRVDRNFIDDLAPLRGHKGLRALWFANNRIRDLSPLADVVMTDLHIHGNPVSDLTPLARASLNSLNATGCLIEDLSPLRQMSLRKLWICHNRIRSLEPLAGMPIDNLYIANNPVSSPEPLFSMALRSLAINGTGIREADALLSIPTLRALDVDADQFSRLRSFGESGLASLRVTGGRLEDLSPLRNWLVSDRDSRLPAEHWLRFHHHHVSDLDVLEGKPLGILSVADNRITSLIPLQGMPLESLSAWGNQIVSLSPLRDSPLRYLDLRFNQISSVSPLSGLEELTMLALAGNQIFDPTPLRTLSQLRWLELQDNMLSDIEPLRTLPLNYLDVTGNQIQSLSPLTMMPLTVLRCGGNRLQSLTGLETRAVVELYCADNQINSLEPILHNPIVTLDCAKNPILNMNVLTRIPTLRELRCDARQLSIFNMIAETDIQELRVVPGGGLHDVSSVSDMETLYHLEIYGQGIEDPSKLVAPPLEYLDISDNPLTTLGALAEAPPMVLLFNSETIPDRELTRLATLWEANDETARHARTARILQAIRKDDVDSLRAMGTRFGESVYLYVPYSATWEHARDMAEAMGGHLATIPREDINTHVTCLLEMGERAWIGLQVVDGRHQWVRDIEFPNSKERLSSFYTRWFTSVIWQGTLYASGRSGARWIDSHGTWHPSDQDDQQFGFIIEWSDSE